MQWFDAGVNCFDNRLPLQSTVEESIQAGVSKLCVIATHQAEWQDCASAVKTYPDNLVTTCGIHPHHADNVSSDWDQNLVDHISVNPTVAIGECGLDYNRMFSTKENQLAVFERQLQIASECGLPVYLHERDAFEDQFKLLSQYADKLSNGLVHCFTQSEEHMQAYLSLGFYIGITGWVCDPKRGEELRQAIKKLPLERMVLETDAPYLFPKNVKPRRSANHPKHVVNIGHFIDESLEVSVAELAERSFSNSCDLFGLSAKGGSTYG